MRGLDNIENPRERFDEYLRRNNKRRTAERFAILEKALELKGHFTADDLGAELRKDFHVSSATVYSTLRLLVDCAIIVKQRFGNACRYEKATGTESAVHHHLICEICGKIKEVRDPLLSRQIRDKRFANFSQNYYTLNIYGICGACSRKKKQSKNTKQK